MVVDEDGGRWAVSAVSAIEGWQRAWEDGFPSRWLFLLRWLFRGRGHSHSKKPLKMPVRRLDPLSTMMRRRWWAMAVGDGGEQERAEKD